GPRGPLWTIGAPLSLTPWQQGIGAISSCRKRPRSKSERGHDGGVGDFMAEDTWDADGIARSVVADSPDAIVALDRDLSVLSWNAAAERLFGWSAEEIVGRRPPIVPDELMAEHNAVLERVRTAADSRGRVSLRTKRFHRDGSLLDLRVDTS